MYQWHPFIRDKGRQYKTRQYITNIKKNLKVELLLIKGERKYNISITNINVYLCVFGVRYAQNLKPEM